MNTKRLNELKEEFIGSILDKCFEFDRQIRSLKKRNPNVDKSMAYEITNQKQKAIRLLAFIMRVYKLEISHKLYTEKELKKELLALKALQKSLRGGDLMRIYCEEIGRWILKVHPTFYAGSLRIIKDLDTEETLYKVKKAH